MIDKIRLTISALLLIIGVTAAKTLGDPYLGYSIVLPDTWVRETVDSTHHQFFDTSGNFMSMVAIVRHDFSGDTIFTTPEEWTRANFIAYTLTVEADPFCNLVFYDSVTVKQNGILWATDAFTEFYSYDSTFGDWAEYVRYTASGTYGYELYVLGPLQEMDTNIAAFASIIDGIILPVVNASIVSPAAPTRATCSFTVASGRCFDARGRCIGRPGLENSSKFVFSRRGRFCTLKNIGTGRGTVVSGEKRQYRSR